MALCYACGRPRLSSWLLAVSCPSAGHCSHLGSNKSANRRSVSLSLCVTFKIKKIFKKIYEWKVTKTAWAYEELGVQYLASHTSHPE